MPITPELLTYIQQRLAQGTSKETITTELLSRGWQRTDVEAAFASLAQAHPTNTTSATDAPHSFLAGSGAGMGSGSLPGVFSLVKAAFATVRERLGTLILLSLFFLLLQGALYLLLASFSFVGGSLIGIVTLFLSGLLSVILSFLLNIWSLGTLLYAITTPKEQLRFWSTVKNGVRILVSLGWITVLQGALVLTGFLLFLIPGILFLTWFAFAPFALIEDSQRGIRALLVSKAYVQGNTLRILGRLVALALSVLVVGALLAIALWLVFLLFPMVFALNNYPLPAGLATGLVSGGYLIWLLLAPLLSAVVAAGIFHLYRALKALHGNRIPEISTAQQRGWSAFALIALLIIPLFIIALPVFLSFQQAHQRVEQARQEVDEKFQALEEMLRETNP